MSLIINVYDTEDESAEWIIMYNVTMNRKWNDSGCDEGACDPSH